MAISIERQNNALLEDREAIVAEVRDLIDRHGRVGAVQVAMHRFMSYSNRPLQVDSGRYERARLAFAESYVICMEEGKHPERVAAFECALMAFDPELRER